MPATYNPGRPPTTHDVLTLVNGSPVFMGKLVSSGSVTVNNLTTATPFNQTPRGPVDGNGQNGNYLDTLAGRALLIQGTTAGFLLPSSNSNADMTDQAGALPGIAITSGERVLVMMQTNFGWLQWRSSGGAGNLLVWELL